MQIASMFASLGFKVDTSGLDKFKQSISQARKEIGYLGANTCNHSNGKEKSFLNFSSSTGFTLVDESLLTLLVNS